MRTADFHFDLPPDLIAQAPATERDESRLLRINRASGRFEHGRMKDFPQLLQSGDVIVFNNSKVIPARLRGVNARTGGEFEILLVEENGTNDWWAMMRPGKRAKPETEIILHDATFRPTTIRAIVTDMNSEGHRRLTFLGTENILNAADQLGEMPLPPYIRRDDPHQPEDRERYQTVFAQVPGSVAAPTAGLHFTPELFAAILARGAKIGFVTLHVGLGTFAPVKADALEAHQMHEERFHVSEETAALVNEAKSTGRRVIAVGTTSVRVLESIANSGRIVSGTGRTRIFIYPPRQFQIVDALLTNFHLPCSTLLMLVSAFAAPGESRGRELILKAYAEAIHERYRFFSYGDAMFIH
jgi:S-adenosylmethionine:tRNA ribosyltransferase-isomerase